MRRPETIQPIANPESLWQSTGFLLMLSYAYAGMAPILLDTQYRMHPLIAEFPSTQFYNRLLHSGITAQDRPLAKGELPPIFSVPFLTPMLACLAPLTALMDLSF